MKSKFSPKLLLAIIPLAIAIGVGIWFLNKNSKNTDTTSSTQLTGIYEEEGEGTSVSGASTMTSVRTGFLLKDGKMYTFQVGIYSTEAEIIADDAGMRDGAYATYSVNNDTLTIMNERGVKQSTCTINNANTITCGNTKYIKNN